MSIKTSQANMQNSSQVNSNEIIQQHTFNKIHTNANEIVHMHKPKLNSIHCKYNKNSPTIFTTDARKCAAYELLLK